VLVADGVPPRRTASVRRSNPATMYGDVMNDTAVPAKINERRSRNISAAGESP
jgi:hypothetical protein